jgi:NADH dehydrogenase
MRVAVFGAGYAGLTLARRLEDSLPESVEILVVDEDSEHVLQHEIHRVIRRPALAEEIHLDLDAVLDRATVRQATVTDVDADAGRATVSADGGEETLTYDFGAVCLGARTAFYDLPGVRDHATPLKRLSHAREIRERFLSVTGANKDETAGEGGGGDGDAGRVIVGGAGLSGVQVAGELAALAREEDAEGVEILLLEQRAAVAPLFPENFQRAVRSQLEDRGVTVRTGATVASADGSGIDLADGSRVDTDQLIWTGGIRGPDALGGERPQVRNTLRTGDRTFVVGDTGQVVDTDGEAAPASAQSAVRQARVAASNLRKLVEHERDGGTGFEPRLEGYTFDSPGWLVSIGDGAVAQVGPTVLTGRAAKALKTSVGAGYLTSVGAVENAVDLVREEMGWPEGEGEGERADPPDE